MRDRDELSDLYADVCRLEDENRRLSGQAIADQARNDRQALMLIEATAEIDMLTARLAEADRVVSKLAAAVVSMSQKVKTLAV